MVRRAIYIVKRQEQTGYPTGIHDGCCRISASTHGHQCALQSLKKPSNWPILRWYERASSQTNQGRELYSKNADSKPSLPIKQYQEEWRMLVNLSSDPNTCYSVYSMISKPLRLLIERAVRMFSCESSCRHLGLVDRHCRGFVAVAWRHGASQLEPIIVLIRKEGV